jgi:hypothetical protein
VVEDFLIQGGTFTHSLDTTKQLPKLNPEIFPEHYHFKGAVGIPRLSDDLNPPIEGLHHCNSTSLLAALIQKKN